MPSIVILQPCLRSSASNSRTAASNSGCDSEPPCGTPHFTFHFPYVLPPILTHACRPLKMARMASQSLPATPAPLMPLSTASCGGRQKADSASRNASQVFPFLCVALVRSMVSKIHAMWSAPSMPPPCHGDIASAIFGATLLCSSLSKSFMMAGSR